MDKLYIIIPAYNEEENILNTVKAWYPVIEKHNGDGHSRLVVIDDGSKDSTYDILLKCADNMPLLHPLTKDNEGHGPTLIYGYKYAIDQNADYVFQTDSDGQTSPDDFEQFWRLRKDYDAVIGYRPDRGDGNSRAFVENVVCMLLKAIFGVKIPDANAPFRLMSSDSLEKFISKLPDDYAVPNIMLSTYYSYYTDRVHFEPISFGKRQAGENSVNWRRIINIGKQSLISFIELRLKM